MTDLARTTVVMEYANGGPGVNVLHWSSGIPAGEIDTDAVDNFHLELNDFYLALRSALPTVVSYRIVDEVQIFTPETGDVTGIVDGTPSGYAAAGSASSGSASRATQINFAWLTAEWRNGRRVQGRSFLGPISPAAMDGNGQVTSSLLEDLQDAAIAFTSGVGPRLAVWTRPSSGSASDGTYSDVVRGLGRSNPGTLRSRKV